MSKNKPIGVFDSGLGGLCALRSLRTLLPHEDFVYFGDTGRTPYGTRSEEKITQYAEEDVKFLLSHGVKAVLAACGTVSAIALDKISENCPVPIYGIIDSSVNAALKITKGSIGVMGTGATVKSEVFQRKIAQRSNGDIRVFSVACPLLVPIVENDLINTDISESAIKYYMNSLIQNGVDTIILGCTHFPLLADKIKNIYPNVNLIDSGAEAARNLADFLKQSDNISQRQSSGQIRYFVSDLSNNFNSCARVFMGGDIGGEIEKVNIE